MGESDKRKACVLYVFEDGITFGDRAREDVVLITRKQYRRAMNILAMRGRRIPCRNDQDFLFCGCLVRKYSFGSSSSRSFQRNLEVYSECPSNLDTLSERLNLPLPRS